MVLPLRVDVPRRSTPVVTLLLVTLNTAAFLYTLSLGESAGQFLHRFGLVPREFLGGPASDGLRFVTPLSAMFLHGGWLHLLGNLLYLWIFGTPCEDLLGVRRFVLFYFVCGGVASAIHVASDPSAYVPTIGASGAVSGLLGAYAVSYPLGWLRLLWPPIRVPALAFLGLWIVFQLASGLQGPGSGAGGVAWWAHVGGFVAGIALVRSMRVRAPARARRRI